MLKFKHKFLLLLSLSLLLCLTIFFVFMSRIFIEDKTTLIRETNLALAENIAERMLELHGDHTQATNVFQNLDAVERMLVGYDGKILDGDKEWVGKNISEKLGADFIEKVNRSAFASGALRIKDPHGTMHIVAFSNSSGQTDSEKNFVIVSQSESMVLRASMFMIVKSVFLFLTLLSGMLFAGVILTNALTRGLEKLQEAMNHFGEGSLNAKVEVSGTDEIASLGTHFNQMSTKINNLMLQIHEKARIDQELAIAKRVQELLLPKSDYSAGKVSLSAFFDPADECGGDWWHYYLAGSELVICIGDVTGHGFPAAMVTTVARGVFTILEKRPELTCEEILKAFNEALFLTVKGSLQMTFFVLKINITTGAVEYSNASHEPSFIIRNGQTADKKNRHIEPLFEVAGPRLGQNENSAFTHSTSSLGPGDRLVLFTDGIFDLKSTTGGRWSERHLVKVLSDVNKVSGNANEFAKRMRSVINTSRAGEKLIDDLCFLAVDFK